ncbi:hypothetical protein HDK77DRAFT_507685 [Phyllosticta capitalensis]|uniref:Uncharacterized protein n=1 Tax=Phyllosticta capitalensis TaxID=121624 RepID=A0ABR1YXC1_9PEZI
MSDPSWFLPPHSKPFIDDETASGLEIEGLLSPAVENKRQLSTKIFALSSGALPPSKHHRMSPNIKSFTEASSVSSPVETITIPDRMGPEVFEYMGLVRPLAEELWEAALNRPAGGKSISIPRWTISHIARGEDVEDWDDFYLRTGITKELTDAILDPRFADIRGTATPRFWLWEVVRARFHFLNDELGQRARVALARLHGRTVTETEPKDSTPGELPHQAAFPACSLKANEPMDGYRVLWRAGYKTKTLSLVDAETGAIMPRRMASAGDFGRSKAVYFTPQSAVADRYAAFYRSLSPLCDVVVARVLIPVDRLTKLRFASQLGSYEDDDEDSDSESDFDSDFDADYQSREWRQLVCAARLRQHAPAASAPPSSASTDAASSDTSSDTSIATPPSPPLLDLLIGPILTTPSLPPPPHSPTTKLTWRDKLLHVHSQRAKQICFCSADAQAALSAGGSGLVTFYCVGAAGVPRERDVVVTRDDGWSVAVRGVDVDRLDRFQSVQFKGMCGAWEFR